MAETSEPNEQQFPDREAASIPEAREFSMELSPVLVIGIAGRIGSGASFVRDKILQSLRTFDYETHIVDVTEIMDVFSKLLSEAELERIQSSVTETEVIQNNDNAKRVRKLQLLGNSFRRVYGNSILAALCVTEFIETDLSKPDEGLASRKAYILDSLKHPEEVALLRNMFGHLFWLVGVVSSDGTRYNRLQQRKGFDNKTFEYLSEQDADSDDELDTDNKRKSGQRTIEAVVEADYFFANDHATKDGIEAEAARLTRLIFGIQVVSPTPDEVGMNVAFQTSLRSACLSRQVGASIVAESGELLSTGYNDVPKFGGGLYGSVPGQDRRCWAWGAKCYNDEEKNKITEQVVALLRDGKFMKKGKAKDAVKALRKSRIKGLIEFTRAVHAEMEAMLSIARLGTQGLVGSTIYSTTYPCHNCAKHIVDAGITRVVYMEPYEKSLARTLHADTINDPLQERSDQKVSFDNFGGVAPKRFGDFFRPRDDRKNDGVFADSDRKRHVLSPAHQEEISTLRERLQSLQSWLDERLSPNEDGDEDG